MSKDTPLPDGPVRLRRPDRSQVVMTCAALDDVLPADHQARVVWAVVERMDLSAFLARVRARAGAAGRDATDPRVLVALWLYAAIDGVGSAREVARLCGQSDPYRWLCGGVSVNHHTLADFRVGHADALDGLFTRAIASLVGQGLVDVHRITTDGTRVRACAGSSSFRRRGRLEALLARAEAHVAELRGRLDDPAQGAALSARQRAARERAARERRERLERALAAMPELEARQRASRDKRRRRDRQPRVSTTDPEARVMKMADGGFRPAVNVQLAVDPSSRAIVGVDACGAGNDAGLAGPMREQVEARAGRAGREQVVDGGYLVMGEVEAAAAAGLTLFVPPKPPRDPARALAGAQYDPAPTDSPAVRDWRGRMKGPDGRAAMVQRSATVETANADLKAHRNLGPRLLVRGIAKAKCVALWAALAYNLMHFAAALIAGA